MNLTRAQAVDEILALANTAWVTTAGQAAERFKWENVGAKTVPPVDQSAWGRIVLRHNVSAQKSLPGADGKRRFVRQGVLTIQVFEPIGKGLVGSGDIPEVMKNAYEGVTTAGGVMFRDVTINEVGDDGDFFQTNVVASFEYDEVK
jgi:hypothetical protein